MVNLSAASKRSLKTNSNNNPATKLTTIKIPQISGKKVNFSDSLQNVIKTKTNCERSDSGFSETNDDKIQIEIKTEDDLCSALSLESKHQQTNQENHNQTDTSNLNGYIPRKMRINPDSKTALLRKKFEN